MIFFRKRHERKYKAAQIEERIALALLADAKTRQDTQATHKALDRLRKAKHEVLRLELANG